MRRIKTYKKWSIWRLTSSTATRSERGRMVQAGGLRRLPELHVPRRGAADVPEGRRGKGQHPGLPVLAEAGAGERRRRW